LRGDGEFNCKPVLEMQRESLAFQRKNAAKRKKAMSMGGDWEHEIRHKKGTQVLGTDQGLLLNVKQTTIRGNFLFTGGGDWHRVCSKTPECPPPTALAYWNAIINPTGDKES